MNLLIVENNFLLKENFFSQSDLKINLVFSTSVKSVKKILNKKKFDFIIISSLAINLNSFHVITNIFERKPKDKIIQILEKSNDINNIRDQLIKIKGIGNWTIDMFLIFSKGYLDIFPEGDLALINVIKNKYQVDSMKEILEISKKWSPYKTVATLYLWESLDDDFPN